MRKKKKKQIITMITTLGDIHEEFKKAIKKRQYESAYALLSDCQAGALAIGTAIEETEGEGLTVVTYIEDYCEMLYQVSVELRGEIKADRNVNEHERYNTLKHMLYRIEKEVKTGIAVQYEIVFLPYKAAMWDALESVWLAAKEDKNCNCYVISIPYFDRNVDQSFGQMYIESSQYPDYVPMTSHLNYDLKEREPDAIFIHNPYDECNYVTSVHPDYYSVQLRNYTDLLVYIPYFVNEHNLPEEFCLYPGVRYSDIVFVQSEEIRQVYLYVIRNTYHLTEEQASKAGLNEKIVALGSPKIDKVVHTRREDVVLPEEWEEKISGNQK